MSRLAAFLFCVYARDGRVWDACFYAPTAKVATRYARAWAQRFGYRVEFVEDEGSRT